MSVNYLTAQAAVAEEVGRVVWREVRVPEPTDDDVVVRVTHSWISNGTEGSFVRGERIAGDIAWRPTDPIPFPHVSGYQKCGIVESVGRHVTDIQPGDRVFASISAIADMFWNYGGHISPAVTQRSQIWKLPDNVSEVAASGLVLLQVGYNCGIRPPVAPGDHAVIIGDGLVGHWAAQTLAWRGAHVALVGRHDHRLEKYRVKEGDILLNEKRESITERLKAWAPEGIQVVVDTVGSVPAFEALYGLMRHNGHIVSAGFYGVNGQLDIQPLRARELTLHTPAGWEHERMNQTLDLLAQGELQTEHLITHRFPASQVAEAFDLILAKRNDVLGVVLDWEE